MGFRQLWTDHGTKVLGALGTVAGVALEAVQIAADRPDGAGITLGGLATAVCVAVIKRGFTNTRNQRNRPQPPDELGPAT